MVYLYLFIAIFLEVVAAIATRYTEGFTAPLPTAITILFAVSSYFIFSLSLKHGMNIGIGYAIWSGVGVVSVAVIGAILLGDTLTFIQIGGIILILIGLASVQLAGVKEDTGKL
jgi:small multidrug resistance pump